eukprot:COSAG03_NODE_3121_length_2201_cov_3.873930_1_plen_528_part_10
MHQARRELVTEALYDYMHIMKLYAVLNVWIVGAPAVSVNRDGTESIPSRRSMQASATCGPCQNGGQCLEQLVDARVCTCLHGYTGIDCGVDYAQCETVIRSKQNVTDTEALREYLSNSPVRVVSQRQELRGTAVHYVACGAFIGLGRYYGDGGAIYIDSGDVRISGSSFTANQAYDDDYSDDVVRYGGAIYIDSGDVRISGSSFTGNQANGGGAICIWSGDVHISGSSFTGNQAGRYFRGGASGGAIHIYRGDVRISGSSFTANQAYEGYGGGAMYIWSGDVRISGSSFTANQARYAGAIYIGGGVGDVRIHVLGSSFTDNQVYAHYDVYGGAIYISIGDVRISGSSFTGNQADYGGAMYIAAGDVRISGSSFTGNQASYDADHISATPRVLILNTSFTPLAGGSASVYIGRESGCSEFPCNSSHGSSCSYRNFSLFCTPCVVDSYTLDGRTCTACSHGQHASQDQRSCTDDRELAIDCAGEWSACSSDCRREWTQTAAPSGTGAACPVEPRCATGEDDCPQDCAGEW